MTKSKTWTIQTTATKPFVVLNGGYAIPGGFTVKATRGGTEIEIEVVVADAKARATRVSIATDDPRGVSSTTVRTFGIRDLVGDGVMALLSKVVPDASGKSAEITPVSTWSEDEVLATKQLVGYIDPGAKR